MKKEKIKLKKSDKKQFGGDISFTGYLPDSPDRDNDYNIIPGNHITMDRVPHDIMAFPSHGDPRLMKANSGLHKFTGAAHVLEIPLKQMGGPSATDPSQQIDLNAPNYAATKDPDVYMGKFGVPITREEYERSANGSFNFTSFEQYANYVGGWAKKPTTTDLSKQDINSPGNEQVLSDKARGLSSSYYPVNKQPLGKTPDTIHSNRYQGGGPVPEMPDFTNYADMQQFTNPNGVIPKAADMREVTEDNQAPVIPLNPVTKKPFPNSATAKGINLAMTGLNTMAGILDQREQKRINDTTKDRMTSDAFMPVTPANVTGNRGDYDANTGAFRPDQETAFSPYGMNNPSFQNGGQPVGSGYNSGLISDIMNVHDVFGGGDALPPPKAFSSLSNPFTEPAIPQNINTGSVNDVMVPSKALPVNDTAKSAYNYYVENHNLSPQTAAAIVGNLYRESGLKTGAVEKGGTGNGRGIAQWDVRDRWPAFLNWAKKSGRDPDELHTQLDYVLVEPGWGNKAVKQTDTASGLQDATTKFGKVFERPNEAAAAWAKRIGYATALYHPFGEPAGKYAIGGEYEVSDEELKQILKDGGQVEYL